MSKKSAKDTRPKTSASTKPFPADSIAGTSLGALKTSTALGKLNDGRGIGVAAAGVDFNITTSGGTASIILGGSKTVGDVLTRINTALGASGHADISADGKGISIVDAGGSGVSVAAVGTSTAAGDLGLLTGTSAGGTFAGRPDHVRRELDAGQFAPRRTGFGSGRHQHRRPSGRRQ